MAGHLQNPYLVWWHLCPCKTSKVSPSIAQFRTDIDIVADFKTTYLHPTETAVVSSGTSNAYDRLLAFYTFVVQNWNQAANASDPETDEASNSSNFAALTSHISSAILSILTSQPNTPLSTATAILTYFTTLASLSSPLTPLTIPDAHTLYTLLFHPSLATLSHLTALLATYKRAFEADLTADTNNNGSTQATATNLPRAVTNAFNGYLMDVANLLWRSRGLTAQDPNALACLCAPGVADALNAWLASLPPLTISSTNATAPGTGPDYALPSLFGLSHNALTASLALAAFQDVEERWAAIEGRSEGRRENADNVAAAAAAAAKHPPGPVTQRTLSRLSRASGTNRPDLNWKTYRVRVLEWLAERGAGGLRDFMFVTMKDLMREASSVPGGGAAAA